MEENQWKTKIGTKKNKGNKLKTLTNILDVNPTVLIKTLKHPKNASKLLLLCLNYYLR